MNTFGVKSQALFLLSIIVVVGSDPVSAAPDWIVSDRQSWMGPQGLALGGALVAHDGRSDFIYSNPAAPSLEEKYTVGFGYGTAGDQLRAQVADTKSSQLGGGISFSQRNIEDLTKFNDKALGNYPRLEHSAVGTLMTKVSEKVGVGISAHHRYIRPRGVALPSKSFLSGDVGVIVALSPEWRLGLAGLDLIADDTGYTHRTLSVGTAGNLGSGFMVLGQLDFVKAPEGNYDTGFIDANSSAALSLGAEYTANAQFRLRGSYRTLPAWEQNYVGLGGGYMTDGVRIDYGVRFSPEDSKAQYHALSITVDI